MLLVKIKPLGWILVALILIGAGITGFALSRAAGGNNAAVAAAGADNSVGPVPEPSKTAVFGHIAADNPVVVHALAADDLDGGEKALNKPCSFQGKVVKVYSPPNKSVEILNFAVDYNNALSAVVEAADYGKLPDVSKLEGKQVVVTGTMIAFKKHLEIKVNDPGQIKIVGNTP